MLLDISWNTEPNFRITKEIPQESSENSCDAVIRKCSANTFGATQLVVYEFPYEFGPNAQRIRKNWLENWINMEKKYAQDEKNGKLKSKNEYHKRLLQMPRFLYTIINRYQCINGMKRKNRDSRKTLIAVAKHVLSKSKLCATRNMPFPIFCTNCSELQEEIKVYRGNKLI